MTTRAEFLKAARALSYRKRHVVVQARARQDGCPDIALGFTATKKVGGAVVRNRAKRRLREAARHFAPSIGRPGTDYVFIARGSTPTASWAHLLDDVEAALLSLARQLDRPRQNG